MEIINNREWALVIWIFAFTLFTLVHPKMGQVRKSLKETFKALFAKSIIIILALMLSYIAIMILGLVNVGLWKSHQLKNTIVWAISVATLYLFRLEAAKNDRNFFKNLFFDNLKLIAIIQFIVGVYTFGIIVELIIVPILAISGAMIAIAQTDEKYRLVEKVLNGFMVSLGVIFIIHTIYMLITNFGEFAKVQTIYDFSIPPLLTFLYLPFIFLMMVFTTYELVFLRLRFLIKESNVRSFAEIYSFAKFNFNIKLLERWASTLPFQDTSSKDSIKKSVKQIFKMVAAEIKPQNVPLSEGWSPYEAKNFLLNEGLKTGHYHPVGQEEWIASSSLIEIGNDLIPNNISYYVDGNETTAKSLKLILNVNSNESARMAHLKLFSSVNVLLKAALGMNASPEIEKAIIKGEILKLNLGLFQAAVEMNVWPQNSIGGYDVKFILSRI